MLTEKAIEKFTKLKKASGDAIKIKSTDFVYICPHCKSDLITVISPHDVYYRLDCMNCGKVLYIEP